MELIRHSAEEYEAAVRKMLPPGEFWDRQLADSSSDVSIWCQTKAQELARFRDRQADLIGEAVKSTAVELIDEWERTLGLDNATLDLSLRKDLLALESRKRINKDSINEIIAMYGAKLESFKFPYFPAFFGRTRFLTRIAGPASFSTLYLYITLPDASLKAKLEATIESAMQGNYILSFFYR